MGIEVLAFTETNRLRELVGGTFLVRPVSGEEDDHPFVEDAAERLEAAIKMDPVSLGILTKRVDLKQLAAGDHKAVLVGNTD